jgi:hypothetical protein
MRSETNSQIDKNLKISKTIRLKCEFKTMLLKQIAKYDVDLIFGSFIESEEILHNNEIN